MIHHYFLGIDSGGTATRAMLADENGRVCGTGLSGSANRNHYTPEEVRHSLQAAIQASLAAVPPGTKPSVIFLGMSGVSTDSDKEDVAGIARTLPEIGPETLVVVDNDTVAGLTGGLAGRPGLALIAGTGSACLGINARGERWLAGGWGALADDSGSAPWVGLRALQAAVRAEDGRSGPTALRQIVFDFLGLTEARQFISRVHNQGLERADIGGLAPLVVAASENGDAAAGAILEDAASELSALASAVARKLFGADPCEMILVGGLARSGPPFQTLLTDRLHREIPALRVVEPDMTPVQGAVLEALRAGGIPWTASLLTHLAATAPK